MKQVKLDHVKERSHPQCRGYCSIAHINGLYCSACGRFYGGPSSAPNPTLGDEAPQVTEGSP